MEKRSKTLVLSVDLHFLTSGPFLESPEKPFLTLLPASVKLAFSYVVKGTKIKITAKCRALRRLRFADTKRILSPEKFRDFPETDPRFQLLNGWIALSTG